MTVITAPPASPASAGRLALLSDTLVVTRRNLRRIARTPRLLAASSLQPVLFVLLFRYVFGGAIHAGAGSTATGFRFHNGVLPALGAIGLVIAFGFAFTWLYALIGLLVGDPETAQLAGFVPVFLLVFASSVFVPVASMPGWLQAFARAQPVTVTVNTVRALAEGGGVAHWAWQSGCWTAAFIAVFGAFAVARYRHA